jgi:4,5-DOPA dioxygenase extradiol
MPVLFVGHGSPMNAIEDNAWSQAWRTLGERMRRPRAVLCVSAHWETAGPKVTGSANPETIHDFFGFPQPLFDARYPAPGDPALAQRIVELLGEDTDARIDPQRGLDHGAWSVLLPMFPDADIPVLQLGIDTRRQGAWHYALARRLAPLRDEGVLILCSGNIVHNLRLFDFRATATPDWALRFRDTVTAHIREGRHAALADWPSLDDAALAVPTPEHYIPLLYALANGRDGDALAFFNDDVRSAIAMTSLIIGNP